LQKKPVSFENGLFYFLENKEEADLSFSVLTDDAILRVPTRGIHFSIKKSSCHVREIPYSSASRTMKNQPFFKRMGFALSGIAAALRLESSFRLQCLAALMVVIVLAWSKPAMVWWALLLLNCGLVLAAELFNTALEHLIDHLHPGLHPSIKIAKDCAAGAVFILSISAACIFVAFLLEMFSS
jgi:undecaprenol kinase